MQKSALFAMFWVTGGLACGTSDNLDGGVSSSDGTSSSLDAQAADAELPDALPRDSGRDGVAIEMVAQGLALADCSKKFQCQPWIGFSRFFGDDVTDCTRQQAAYIARSLNAPGASTDYSGIRQCIDELDAATCSAYIDYSKGGEIIGLPSCIARTPGTLADNAPCAYGRQCASGFCASDEGSCGRCRPYVGLGARCNAGSPCDTELGLVCGPGATCAAPRKRGESCDSNTPCQDHLLCRGACVDYPTQVGTRCNPVANDCSFRVSAGLTCNNRSNSCELPELTGQPGDLCGLGVPSGGLVMCTVGNLCRPVQDAFRGRCAAGRAAGIGEPCLFPGEGPNGKACEAEAKCVSGRCKIDEPSTCP